MTEEKKESGDQDTVFQSPKKEMKPKKKLEPHKIHPDSATTKLSGMKLKKFFIPLFILIFIYVSGAFYYHFTSFPKLFTVQTRDKKPGVAYTEALIQIGEHMVSNWVPNDILAPTILLDNFPNFQLGELEGMRYSTRILRDNLSRIRTTDKIDKNADQAYTSFSYDPSRWLPQSAGGRYTHGLKGLKAYLVELENDSTHFYPRADNLNEFIKQYISLLGGVSQRLANAPRGNTARISEETAGDIDLKGEKTIEHLTPWMQIDDNFYYARGTLYVLKHLMEAIKYDFDKILVRRNAHELIDAIMEVLDRTQFNPIFVANGDLGSLWANHSLELQALLEDARQKMRSLQSILEQ